MEMCYALDAFAVGSLLELVTEGLVLGIRGRAIKHLLYNTPVRIGRCNSLTSSFHNLISIKKWIVSL